MSTDVLKAVPLVTPRNEGAAVYYVGPERTITREMLLALLTLHGTPVVAVLGGGPVGIFQGVTRESGCGKSFLLNILNSANRVERVYVKLV